MNLGSIDTVILFGGAPLLVGTVKALLQRGYRVFVYTSPRHAAEPMDASGTTLADMLKAANQEFVVTEDINSEPTLPPRITRSTLGLGLGEAWSFSPRIIEAFGGRLLDFMGIPHPRYRGGAHYTWMILRGDRQMGMNLQVINEDMVQGEFDSGSIVKSGGYQLPASCRVPQDYFDAAVPHETAFIAEFLDEVRAGKDFVLTPPDESKSMFLPRLHTKTHGLVDWSWSGQEIERFICAFDTPYPGASTHLRGEVVHLKGATLRGDEAPFHPYQSGLVTRVSTQGVTVATRSGHLEIRQVFAGGREITREIKIGSRFDTPPADLALARVAEIRYGTGTQSSPPQRAVTPDEHFDGERVRLRLVRLDDCTPRYVGWLSDPAVNRFLETRWSPQSLESVRDFVRSMLDDPGSYLFAIVDRSDGQHIGNLKIGPINRHHQFADVSYFIGDVSRWGRGLATDAIRIATRIGFERLMLHRLQAGVYGTNGGSCKALERAGYSREGVFAQQLRNGDGWDDHHWFGLLRNNWSK